MTAAPFIGLMRAASRPLSDQIAAGPDASSIMLGYFRPIALGRVLTKIVQHQVVEEIVAVSTRGVVMPLRSTELAIKPEGERAWEWKKIFATPDLVLKPDDVIEYRGTRYRIMGQADWSQNGMVKYEAVNDYTRGNPV